MPSAQVWLSSEWVEWSGMGSDVKDRMASGDMLTASQNCRNLSTRSSGGLPAIKAALTAPIEMPATQSGCLRSDVPGIADAATAAALLAPANIAIGRAGARAQRPIGIELRRILGTRADGRFVRNVQRPGRDLMRATSAPAAHHGQLEVWAENCPENFENRAALVAG